MRNLKKVLTLVLTLAMLLSVMVVGAGAATFGDQESITNKEAVDVCTTLNIIGGYEDGTFRPAGNVTRAEMCKMICVALNGGKEPSMGSNLINTFNDVGKDHWAAPYIEYCVSQSIVGGVGGGNFNPNGNITGTQAAKMLLCILGYNASIQGYVGNDFWETKINVDAAQKGLYDGLSNIDASAALTRDGAAQMIWNALNAYEVEYITTLVPGPGGTLTSQVDVRDKVVGNNDDKITLLEDKYEAKTFVGNFTADSKMDTSLKDGFISLNGALDSKGNKPATNPNAGFDVDFASNLDIKYIGEEVKVIYKDKVNDGRTNLPDEKDTIYGVYVTNGTTVVNATLNDIDDDYDVKATDKVSIADKVYKVAATGTITYNLDTTADSTWSSNGKNAIQGLQEVSGDTVKFILNDKNEITHVYVTNTVLSKVTAVSGSKVSLAGTGLGTVDTSKNDTSVYSGVAKDDIVAVTKLYASKVDDATFVIEKADTATGNVTGFSNTDGGKNKTITMNGTVYSVYGETDMSTLVDDYDQVLDKDSLDKEYTLYLVNGYVWAAQEGADSMNQYAIVLDTNSGKLDSTFDEARAELLLADGTKVNAVLHKDSEIFKSNNCATGADGDSVYTDATKLPKDVAINAVGNSSNGEKAVAALQVNQLVKYTVMSNGQYKIRECGIYGEKADGDEVYNKDKKTFDGTLTDNNCVLFYTNSEDAMKAANIRNLNTIKAQDNNTLYAAVENSDGKVVAAFIDYAGRPSGVSNDTMYGIITSNGTTMTKDGDTYTMFKVWTGAETEIYIEGDTPTVTKGNLIYFDKSADDTYDESADIHVLNGGSVAGGVVGAVTGYVFNDNQKTISVASAIKYENNAYVATGKDTTYAVDSDVQIVYIDADGPSKGDDNGTVDTFNATTGYANVLLVFDGDNVNNKVVAIIVNTNSDVNVLGEEAVSGANAVTAPADVTANGLTAKVTTNKATAVAGETVTVTVKLTGTDSSGSNSTIAATGVTPTAGSYASSATVAGVTLNANTGVTVADSTDLSAGYTFTYTFTMGSSAATPSVTIS